MPGEGLRNSNPVSVQLECRLFSATYFSGTGGEPVRYDGAQSCEHSAVIGGVHELEGCDTRNDNVFYEEPWYRPRLYGGALPLASGQWLRRHFGSRVVG